MYEWKTIKELRYWVHKVLPLVYDDSLSYYELLNKVVLKLNDLIENNAMIPDFVTKMIEEFVSSGEIEEVLSTIIGGFILNVKYPPNGLTPAIGNGATDDTATIQGCIDYIHKNGGGAVYFPSGKYLSGSLTIYDNTCLYGFDRYSATIVHKGGANSPLISGTVSNFSIVGLGLDGNGDVQVNNLNLIDVTCDSGIITNAKLTDGNILVKANINNDLQITDTILDRATTKACQFDGTGYVQGDNLIFNSVSLVGATCYCELNTNNSILEMCKFVGASPVGVIINGDNNAIRVWRGGCTNAYQDNGKNSDIVVYTEEWVNNGNLIVDKFEGYNVTVNPDGNFKYKEAVDFDPANEFVKWIPVLDENGNTQKAVVAGDGFGDFLSGINSKQFDTATEMAADTNLTDGTYVHTGGLNAFNDGKSDFYRVVNDETKTNNAMNIPLNASGLYAEKVLKNNPIPKITDYGDLSLATIRKIINSDVPVVYCTGSLVISEPIEITRPITLVCEDFTVTQTVWGYPGIIVNSDNVNILGEITLVMDVEERTPITSSSVHWHPTSGDPKSDSSGIMLGYSAQFKNFYADRINVYNFIAGVVNTSIGFTNIHIDYLYVKNVDFGLFGAHYIDTYVRCVEFKDIASYIGSVDPSHAIYLTGGVSVGLSKNVTVDQIYGDGCRSKATDAVISIKSTTNLKINSGYVKNIACLASVSVSTGVIKNIIGDVCTGGISGQVENTDFLYENIMLNDVSITADTYMNYFTNNSNCRVKNCKFNIISDITDRAIVYISAPYYEENCEYNTADTNAYVYQKRGAPKAIVKNPKCNTKMFTGDISPNDIFYIDPSRLNYPTTNTLIPNPVFLPNNYIADEAENTSYPFGFRTNDKLRITNGAIGYFNNNNATNGQVYTLYNGLDENGNGTTTIVAGARLVTKTGQSYAPTAWKVFRFVNIGNVAIEI